MDFNGIGTYIFKGRIKNNVFLNNVFNINVFNHHETLRKILIKSYKNICIQTTIINRNLLLSYFSRSICFRSVEMIV